jgi:hypothetical protein
MTSMPIDLRPLPSSLSEPKPDPTTLSIETFSYEDRRVIFPAVSEALELCGCWVLNRRPISLTQMEFRFELQLRSVVDLYAALISAGLELTRASHNDLTVLCVLRRHRDYPSSLAGVVTVQLVISFMEDVDLPTGMWVGSAHA